MKVTELAAHWRGTATRLEGKPNVAGMRPYIEQLNQCADELESAIEAAVFEAAQTPPAEQCGCGHALSRHGASGCLAPAPLGDYRTFCVCRRRVTP